MKQAIPKFVTQKIKIVNDQSNVNYDAENEITYNTEVLKFTIIVIFMMVIFQ